MHQVAETPELKKTGSNPFRLGSRRGEESPIDAAIVIDVCRAGRITVNSRKQKKGNATHRHNNFLTKSCNWPGGDVLRRPKNLLSLRIYLTSADRSDRGEYGVDGGEGEGGAASSQPPFPPVAFPRGEPPGSPSFRAGHLASGLSSSSIDFSPYVAPPAAPSAPAAPHAPALGSFGVVSTVRRGGGGVQGAAWGLPARRMVMGGLSPAVVGLEASGG